jgi:hypothetical protein
MQVPFWQSLPPVQALPQAPQLLGSSTRFVQNVGLTTGHAVWPVLQACLQEPRKQAWPAAQAPPHPPQLSGSVWKLVQVVMVPDVGQRFGASLAVQAQALELHVAPAAQTVPHAPQLLASSVRLAQ